ncbi:response regulator transcription factor [Flavobacterium franklandianum]|uniref:Response regulator transcription factor n=2 Tax=Flavobacterium TaxID=237 RepID=A0A553CQI6_9FLAO|nr:response regulator [Flavobacterium franklandianum]TRX22803.1 response regulator transcription factor [Flavobacterium franklandianum]TRX24374.1 response regulator transcription factor [Flavobacterium franklandianum]
MKFKKSEILLIEDDLALGSSISEVLQLSDFKVNWFTNGLEALDYLQNYLPDIIISDLMMPHMDGGELFTKIRKNSKFNAIPFIIITANMDDGVKYKQLENGVNDYIMKPFKANELIFKIKNLLVLRNNIEKKYKPDPFSKVTIKLSKKDFLESVDDFILKNLKSKISIEEISIHLFISKSTLDKKIRKLTNKNITQYIREFKLEYAIKLIDLGERNIQFLVDETGFNSFSYFSTSFKSYVGLTTRDYIKSLQD